MYHQLTEHERYTLGLLRRQGLSSRGIARILGRAPSTISREIRRNACHATDSAYRPSKAQERTNGRRRRSRRPRHQPPEVYEAIEALLRQEQWSPEQIACRLAQHGVAQISTMTIYRYVRRDQRQAGDLFWHLRQGGKKRRARLPPDPRRSVRRYLLHPEAAPPHGDRGQPGHAQADPRQRPAPPALRGSWRSGYDMGRVRAAALPGGRAPLPLQLSRRPAA